MAPRKKKKCHAPAGPSKRRAVPVVDVEIIEVKAGNRPERPANSKDTYEHDFQDAVVRERLDIIDVNLSQCPEYKEGFDHSQFRTPLFLAAMKGKQNAARLLIDRGVNVNAVNDRGETALYWAYRMGHEGIATMLLHHGADQTIGTRTPLMAVAFSGNVQMVKQLVDTGANVNAHDEDRLTALHHACCSPSKDQVDIIKILLTGGAETALRDKWQRTALDIINRQAGDKRDVIDLLTEDTEDRRGATDLITGAIGSTDEVIQCSTSGSGLARMHHGTLLLQAICGNDVLEVQRILDRFPTLFDDQLLPWAARKGHGRCDVIKFLIDRGIDINTVCKGFRATALYFACAFQSMEIQEFLMANGADPTIGDSLPLMGAASHSRPDVVRTLLRDPRVVASINKVDRSGQSALHRACCETSDNREIIRLLIDHGADLSLKDEWGRTPLDTARAKREPVAANIRAVEEAIEEQAFRTRKLRQLIEDQLVITEAYDKGKTRSQRKRKAIEAAPEHLKQRVKKDTLASLPRLQVTEDEEEEIRVVDEEELKRFAVAEHVVEGKLPADLYVELFDLLTPK